MASGDLNIGQRLVWGEQYPFGISALNRRRHVYVIGQTGTGKSTLLTSFISQDMAAGQGLCLIDPHGDLVNDVLDHVPPSRIDDVIVFDPTDPQHAVGWNPFYRVPEADRALVASNMVAAFRHVWQDSWGPRLEYILFNAVAALLDAPDECRATFLSVARFLVDREYRKKVLAHVTDPRVRSFFVDEFDRWPERQVVEALGPVQNKIGQVVAHPQVRAMLCQWRPSFDVDEVLAKRRILLLRLPKGEIGADPANLTGSLLVAALLQASMRRAPASRVPFHLFIDEFQNFTTDAFSSILSESRKYGLTLTISHQYLDQLTPSVRSAVLGNVGSLIVFRVGAGDAEALADELGDITGQALRDLLRGEVVVRLTQEAEVSQAFRGTTSVHKTSVGTREKAVAQSRRVYGRQRIKVMARIAGWLKT